MRFFYRLSLAMVLILSLSKDEDHAPTSDIDQCRPPSRPRSSSIIAEKSLPPKPLASNRA